MLYFSKHFTQTSDVGSSHLTFLSVGIKGAIANHMTKHCSSALIRSGTRSSYMQRGTPWIMSITGPKPVAK